MTTKTTPHRTRPYEIRAQDGRAMDSDGWWYDSTDITIYERVQPTVECEICRGDGEVVGEDDLSTECPICAGDGELPTGPECLEERGHVRLDRRNAEAVRWLDGTLVDELEDQIDRLMARLDQAHQILTCAGCIASGAADDESIGIDHRVAARELRDAIEAYNIDYGGLELRVSMSFEGGEIVGLIKRRGPSVHVDPVAWPLDLDRNLAHLTLRSAVIDGRVRLPDSLRASIDQGAPVL